MTSRERVLYACSHKEPDRVPLDLGCSVGCRFSKAVYSQLVRHLGLQEPDIRLVSKVAQSVFPSEACLQKLQVDVRAPSPSMGRVPSAEWEDSNSYFLRDEWGTEWRMPKSGGFYYDMVGFPLAGKEGAADRAYCWPAVPKADKIETLAQEIQVFSDSGYAVVFPYHFGNGFLQMGPRIYGFEQWFQMLVLEPRRVEAFLDKLLELKIHYWDVVLEAVGGLVDVVCESDDLGTQNGLWISLEMYRRLIKPRQVELFRAIRTKTAAKIFFHSCGSIVDIIPDLIEAGIDILNPIQVSAARMDTRSLKKLFGDVLVFWGGGIDTQQILPRGSPEQVRDEVRRRIEDLAPGGGYVFAPVHNIQPDVPLSNLMAMWEAFMEYRHY